MEMQQVRYFLALTRTLNFTRAAEQANVTQPALTRAIQQLEAELGGPLFHRERSKTHLSELGRMMLPYFEAIQAQTEAARSHATSLKKLETAKLRIGCMCTIGPVVIAGLIVNFRREHPGVELTVYDREAPKILELMADGKIDVALFGAPEILDVRFHSLPLFTERFVVCLPKGHRLESQNVVRVRDLNGEPYVGRAECEYYDYATEEFARLGVKSKKVFSSPRDDWVQSMIKSGLGFGFFPEFTAFERDIVVRRLIEPEFSRQILLVTMRGRPHSPAVGAFVRQARSYPWPKSEEDAPSPLKALETA
jgi:DNA-binding transcriptional LysR family regulator